jgi:hypothetical protein
MRPQFIATVIFGTHFTKGTWLALENNIRVTVSILAALAMVRPQFGGTGATTVLLVAPANHSVVMFLVHVVQTLKIALVVGPLKLYPTTAFQLNRVKIVLLSRVTTTKVAIHVKDNSRISVLPVESKCDRTATRLRGG